jgi:hypothetical protein
MPVPELADGRVDLRDGWSLELPSPCMAIRNADGSWSVWDQTRAIDVHIISVGGHADGSPFPAETMPGMPATISGHGWIGARLAAVRDDNFRWPITVAAENTVLSCWVASGHSSDEHWARTVEAGIRHC